jgi:hypothetical protein
LRTTKPILFSKTLGTVYVGLITEVWKGLVADPAKLIHLEKKPG